MFKIVETFQSLRLQNKLFIGFGSFIVAFALFAAIMFGTIKEQDETFKWVVHTHNAVAEAKHLIKLMVDMETGERGFLIVGKENFLEPFNQGMTKFDKNMEALKKRVSDNPDQVALLEKIDGLALQWRNQVAKQVIAKRREVKGNAKDLHYLQSLLAKGTGKNILDKMRATLDQLGADVRQSATLSGDNRHKAELLTISLAKDMVDQETGQRGFLITGKESFLEPFIDGKKAFAHHIEELRRLDGIDDAINHRITEVAVLAQEWWDRAAEAEIAARREIDLATTTMRDITAIIEKESGKQIMDEIRYLIDTFISVENRLMTERRIRADKSSEMATFMALLGALLSILVGGIAIMLVNRTISPLNQLTATMGEIAKSQDFARRVEIEGMIEVTKIAEVFNQMAQNTQDQAWLKTNATIISKILQESDDTTRLIQQLAAKFGELLDCGFGAVYLHNEKNGRYELTGSYRFKERKHSQTSYAPGEGLVGQCALENRTMILTGVPEDYVMIHSGLGEAAPNTVLAIPIALQHQVLGVMELATFGRFTPFQQALIEEQVPNVAIGLQSILNKTRTKELLEETQVQAEELQVREEELRDNNIVLETQAQDLKKSRAELEERNEQLQVQQEELRIANEELESKAKDLKNSRLTLEHKNQSLEEVKLELERRAEELAVSSRYKSEFLANMSHELRTPLNSMLILARLLSDNKEGNLSTKQVEYSNTIYDSGNDLLSLINDILDLSKIESGKMEVLAEPVHIADFVEEMERKFIPMAESKDILFAVDAGNAPETIRSDGKKLGQIIKNLISNAVKFTNKGKVSLTIGPAAKSVRFYKPGLTHENALCFSVIDTGVGIPKDKFLTIFEAFQQADGSTNRKYGGTGLGLSISRELARLLGGEIQLESEVDKGATFNLFIPKDLDMTDSAAPKEPSTAMSPDSQGEFEPDRETAPQPAAGIPTPTSSEPQEPREVEDDRHQIKPGDRSILIIEDDDVFSSIVADVAQERGFSVLVVNDGETGLHFADFHRPSGIILDIGLPGLDGWKVMERLKDNPNTRHIPVHFMSAMDESLDAMKNGAVGFLTKPISMEAMGAAFGRIENIIDRPAKRLLLVEDDPLQLESMRSLIGNGDVETVTAESGKKAAELLADGGFDCIVLDLGLPDMDGLELLENIRLKPDLRQIPVVVYTGKELEPKERAALDHYAQSIIVKDARSPERLLDDTTLFLHRIESNLPEKQRKTIRMLHDSEAVFDGRKVLLVDDDMRNTFSLSALLHEKKMQVLVADTGVEALNMLESNPDTAIVLMDIMMPEMDGYEATRKIREQERFANLPIRALTAKAMKGDRAQCIAAGANDYLTKPVNNEKLLSMMRVWLYQ